MTRRTPIAVLVLGLAVAGAAAGLALTTNNGRPAPAATALHVAAGLTFIAVGVVVWLRNAGNRIGPLVAAVGFAWFVTDLRYISSSAAFTVADMIGVPLAYAVLAHVALAYPSGRLHSRRERVVATVVYAWVVLQNFGQDVFFAPATGTCSCPHNLLVVHRDAHLHAIVANTQQAINVALALVVFTLILDHWFTATRPARRALQPIFWASGPIVLAILALQAVGAFGSLNGLESALPFLTPIALMTVPFGILAGFVRSGLSRMAVGQLVVELGDTPPPGRLRDTLARTLGDPTLQVAYWTPQSATYVDIGGRHVDVTDMDGRRAVTLIERDGAPVAALLHDPSLKSDPWLIDAVAAAAGLALQNERLQADVIAQLAEVRASRARIVEAGDAERRRLERNLHDGAQQRLVSLSLALRLLGEHVERGADDQVRGTLDAAAEQLRVAIAELRELASGIHPAILTEAGLEVALQSLAERAPLPVTVTAPSGRFSPAIEAAAYFVVSEALANIAKHAAARTATVCVHRRHGDLVLEITDDGVGGADLSRGTGLRGLEDRVSALNGTLKVVSPQGGGTHVVVVIPCA